jgi:alanine dehydrogenase
MCKMLREGTNIVHLSPPRGRPGAGRKRLMKSKSICIAYETVTCKDGRTLPLLQPMSEIAGRLSITGWFALFP